MNIWKNKKCTFCLLRINVSQTFLIFAILFKFVARVISLRGFFFVVSTTGMEIKNAKNREDSPKHVSPLPHVLKSNTICVYTDESWLLAFFLSLCIIPIEFGISYEVCESESKVLEAVQLQVALVRGLEDKNEMDRAKKTIEQQTYYKVYHSDGKAWGHRWFRDQSNNCLGWDRATDRLRFTEIVTSHTMVDKWFRYNITYSYYMNSESCEFNKSCWSGTSSLRLGHPMLAIKVPMFTTGSKFTLLIHWTVLFFSRKCRIYG